MPPILSPFIEKQRFKQVLPYITGDILDLGCGYGRVFKWLQPGSNYLGIEGNDQIIKWLYDNYPDYSFLNFDLDHDQITLGRQFDTILFLAVIEHLKHPSNIINQIASFLKPDGKLLITTPTPFGNTVHRIGSLLNLFNRQAVDEHEIIFTQQTLEPLISAGGLQIDHFCKFLYSGNQLFVCSIHNSS
jgi:2-polyprenyl-3-methyl-5-hydroxy-6-metoxy-1,4-benzoquinol methylase